MNRVQALRGAEQRIGALVLGRPETGLTGIPIPEPAIPAYALPPGENLPRVCVAMTLVVPQGLDVFAMFSGDWQAAGFQPRSWMMPEGPVVSGADPLGFVLLLVQRTAGVELYVISPGLTRGGADVGSLIAGLAVGAAIGFLGPCLSTIVSQGSGPGNYLWFAPFALAAGVILTVTQSTRRFGIGLLIGAAALGIITAGMCAQIR